MFFASIMTQCLLRLNPKMFNGVVENKVDYRAMMKLFIPIALFYAMSLVLSNQAYKYLSVSYIQMLKSFTPVYILGISVLGGLEKPSLLQVLVVLMICSGVSLSSIGEMEFVLLGFIFQMCGGLSESIRLVLQDKMLRDIKLDSLSTIYYLAPPSFLFIAVGFFIFEYSSFKIDLLTPQFIVCLFINGFMAFFLNIAVVLLIKNTSSLTFSVTGLFKDIMLVTFSTLIFQNPVTNVQLFGYMTSLVGMNMYKVLVYSFLMILFSRAFHLLTHSLTHSHTYSLSYALTQLFTHAFTHLLTYSRTRSYTYLLTDSHSRILNRIQKNLAKIA